ncbi:acid protease [Cutaneotrichosporon oleaginosum]|uniref:Acid protease n=1 Tax=Cutaneotrichosporon oleaginosum TaxID=879819 RepID=A0A0J0XDM2_9TREE|nr:acid protease [Cutaneotrichosporon oleaginosum]KLT39200.1 acid protease [Cutaneotrichosporon oleaginosum]TXT04410.1 hypothetical protein COLE_07229 [Cutaneotrichosporon oleaginosum]
MLLRHSHQPRSAAEPSNSPSQLSAASQSAASNLHHDRPNPITVMIQIPWQPQQAEAAHFPAPSSSSLSSPSSLAQSHLDPPSPPSLNPPPPPSPPLHRLRPRQEQPPPAPSEPSASPTPVSPGFAPPWAPGSALSSPSPSLTLSGSGPGGPPLSSPSPSSSNSGSAGPSGVSSGAWNGTGPSSAMPTSSGKGRPWSFTLTPSASKTTTTSGTYAAQVSFVPGVVFNLTLAGGNDDTAVYSLPMTFGHDLADGVDARKRAPTTPTSAQTVNMLVDLGSSDMWIASMNCTSKDCMDAPALFNDTHSLDSDTPLGIDYHSGSIRGNIMWEQVTVGQFGIGYQAMVSAEDVRNENLGDGNFTGLLGLALPANSLITETIPGTTGSSPDGATFLDNLFGAGASAPTNRYFSLSLERSEDVRTVSSFGIGEVDSRVCPSPCAPKWLPILPHPRFGRTGYLHWRVPLDGVYATFFNDPKNGVGPTTRSIPLGSTRTDANSTSPVAVLDSGGVGILVNDRNMLAAIYGPFGVEPDADGKYRLPCNVPLTLTFTFGGIDYPVHPLDMSYIDTEDASFSRCLGVLQYADLNNRGDFVLGSSFLKNVYSIYQYPDQRLSPTTWQPTVGMIPLTDPALAARDFWQVRRERQPLSGVSSGTAGGPGNAQQSAAANAGQKRVATSTIIAVCSVIGFLAIAAGAYFAWWFWNRRRHGKSGVVEYKMAQMEPGSSSPTLRTRKHVETMRQKSMVEGYSDFDIDSYNSTTAGTSVNGMQQTTEEDDIRQLGETISRHTRGSSIHQGLLTAGSSSPPILASGDFMPGVPRTVSEPLDLRRERTRSSGLLLSPPATTGRLVDVGPPPSSPPTARYSLTPSVSTPGSMTMMGAYPSHNRAMSSASGVTSGTRTSEYDYFPVFSEATLAAGSGAEQRRGSHHSGRRSSRGSVSNRTP